MYLIVYTLKIGKNYNENNNINKVGMKHEYLKCKSFKAKSFVVRVLLFIEEVTTGLLIDQNCLNLNK